MNKILAMVASILLIFNLNLYAESKECKVLLKRKPIDLDIKSNKGWNRVCHNGKIDRYLNHCDVSKATVHDLCKCLYERYKLEREINKGAFDDN